MRSESSTRSDRDRAGGADDATRVTPGSASSAGSTRKRSRPRGRAASLSGGRPPCSGMRITTLRASLPGSALRLGKVTVRSSGNSSRPRRLTAPERSQASQPPPSQAAQVKLRGSSSSTTSPDSSQVCGTRMRCNTSGPRGTFNVRFVTLARTSVTPRNSSLTCARSPSYYWRSLPNAEDSPDPRERDRS